VSPCVFLRKWRVAARTTKPSVAGFQFALPTAPYLDCAPKGRRPPGSCRKASSVLKQVFQMGDRHLELRRPNPTPDHETAACAAPNPNQFFPAGKPNVPGRVTATRSRAPAQAAHVGTTLERDPRAPTPPFRRPSQPAKYLSAEKMGSIFVFALFITGESQCCIRLFGRQSRRHAHVSYFPPARFGAHANNRPGKAVRAIFFQGQPGRTVRVGCRRPTPRGWWIRCVET